MTVGLMECSTRSHDMNLASRKAEEAGLRRLLSFISLSLAYEKNVEKKKFKNSRIGILAVFLWLFGF